jgi:hypothetical protein
MSESSIEASLVEVAIQQLKRKPFVAEYNRRPVGEKQEFMMAYACYVMWLIMVGASKSQEPAKVKSIVESIHTTFRKYDWYRAGLFERIWESIQDFLPAMRPPPNTGILIPLVHVILAANNAGCHLQQTTEPTVMFDSVMVMKELTQIAAAPKKRWQFWK